ncbi:MAG: glycosyltransferase family 39 protein [Solirubrobacteraceae bacterium]
MRSARPFWLTLGAIMAGALALRVWGTSVGLPYVYNVDEGAHFVPRAVGMFDHDYDPGYFINPPGLTYLLHGLLWLRWGGDETRQLVFEDPGAVFAYARVSVAVLATLAVGLIAWVGTRLFDRRVALVAAALLAVAFLPVHYGHFALNDAALLVPVCLSLAGAAGILAKGRLRDYLLAGLALGVAAAFKYTAGIVLVPLLAAAVLAPTPWRTRLGGVAVALVASLAGFLALNPYALLSFDEFRGALNEQSAASSDTGGKLGLELIHPLRYYLETLGWGLGIVPVVVATAGGVALALRHLRIALLLIPAPLLFFAFMGSQERFFARWALPVYPFIILLAAWGAVRLLERVPRVGPAVVVGVAALALGAQGLVYSVHNDTVLTLPDTREDAREWMLANIPAGAQVVIEPIAPDAWSEPWVKRATSHFRVNENGNTTPLPAPKLEDYERTLRPYLIGAYRRSGDCWVVTGSILSGRPFVTPDRAPYAIKYYRALERRAERVFAISPLAEGAKEPPFSFDDSYNWRPLSYTRPGPRIVIYRLRGGRCA